MKKIVEKVKEDVDVRNDEVIKKRVYKLRDDGILDNKTRGMYNLNTGFHYEFIGEPIEKPKETTIEIPAEIRRNHTLDLKEAIRIWIANFPEPNDELNDQHKLKERISACEGHVLFTDLVNHLPKMGYNVCIKWLDYKRELEELENMKMDLLQSIENEIRNCFKGLNLKFRYKFDYETSSLYDYESIPLPAYDFDVIMDMSSGNEEKAEEAFKWHDTHFLMMKHHSKILEKGNHAILDENIQEVIRVPKNERELLMKGQDNYIKYLENLLSSSLFKKGKIIQLKIKELEKEKSEMTRELERILFYALFSGDFEYL